MQVTIYPTKELSGNITAPPSKSETHRRFLASSLSYGTSEIKLPLYSDDTLATLDVCRVFGSDVKEYEKGVVIHGPKELYAPKEPINCKQSGTTWRMVIPVASTANGTTKIIFEGRKRPIEPLLDALRQLEVECFSEDEYITVVGNTLEGGNCSLPGNISSQFISGLLIISPLAKRDVKISLTTELVSKPYVDMTIDVMRDHGIDVDISEDYREYKIRANQRYRPYNSRIKGDWSSASNLLVGASITNSEITIKNLYKDKQADRKIVDVLKKCGIRATEGYSYVKIYKSGKLRKFEVDCNDSPDLVIPLIALGLNAKDISTIYGVKRLEDKESNRIEAILNVVESMGGYIVHMKNKDALSVGKTWFKSQLYGTTIDSHNDHRIAMLGSLLALKSYGKTKILNAECVIKSYPSCWEDLKKLGVKIGY